jgi:hypothetical protein
MDRCGSETPRLERPQRDDGSGNRDGEERLAACWLQDGRQSPPAPLAIGLSAPAAEQPGQGIPSQGIPGQETPGHETPGHEKHGLESNGLENHGHEITGSDR